MNCARTDLGGGRSAMGVPTAIARRILHGTEDRAAKTGGSRLFHGLAGSTDKTLKLYEGHFHDLLRDIGKENVMADILGWIKARIPSPRVGSGS